MFIFCLVVFVLFGLVFVLGLDFYACFDWCGFTQFQECFGRGS